MNHLNKYIQLIDIIKRGGSQGVLFDDIADKWRHEYGETLSKRTFQHQKGKIEELFCIAITCDRSTNRYAIEHLDALRDNEVRRWILDTFSVGNTLMGALSLRDRIVVDNQPSSFPFLPQLLEAMKGNNIICMVYHSIKFEDPITISIAPYFVKLHDNRWYMYGIEVGTEKLKIYALDRIKEITKCDERFELPADFSAYDTLYTAYGVTLYDDIKPTNITIKTYGIKSKYLDTLPIHHSQRKISDDTYELYVAPTGEFISEILRQGNGIEIVSPIEVREQVIERLKLIHSNYV